MREECGCGSPLFACATTSSPCFVSEGGETRRRLFFMHMPSPSCRGTDKGRNDEPVHIRTLAIWLHCRGIVLSEDAGLLAVPSPGP